MTSFAGLLAPLTVGPLADAKSLRAALAVVPIMLALAAAGLTLVRRAPTRADGAPRTAAAPDIGRDEADDLKVELRERLRPASNIGGGRRRRRLT